MFNVCTSEVRLHMCVGYVEQELFPNAEIMFMFEPSCVLWLLQKRSARREVQRESDSNHAIIRRVVFACVLCDWLLVAREWLSLRQQAHC